MFRGGNLQPVVNRRIQSKLHQVYSLEQTKRGLCPYDDKRYLLADFPDGRANPNTHAYGHRNLANEAQLEEDAPERPGSDIIIARRENWFVKRHARVVKKVAARALRGSDDDEETADGELNDVDLARAERSAAARPGGRRRLENVIEHIARMNNIDVPLSPPPRLPPQQRAGPSGTNRPGPPTKARRIVYSSDEEGDAPVRQVWPPPMPQQAESDQESEPEERRRTRPAARRRRARNPFIDAEAGVDGDASADEDDLEDDPTMGGFIARDDDFS